MSGEQVSWLLKKPPLSLYLLRKKYGGKCGKLHLSINGDSSALKLIRKDKIFLKELACTEVSARAIFDGVKWNNFGR